LVDPFKESFDIRKATNLRRYIEMEEVKDVSDPRFEKHLRKKLSTLFAKADTDKSGKLDFQEFVTVVQSLNFGLGAWDMRMLMAIVDKNGDGVIEYSEFLNLAIDLIMCALMRQKLLVTQKELKTVAKESLRVIYGDEIAQVALVLGKQFRGSDPESKGVVSREIAMKVLTAAKMITMKERNLLMANYTETGQYEYKNFQEHLLEIRHQIVISGLLESHLHKIEEEMVELFKRRDTKGSGFLTPQQIKEALLESNFTNLTLLQIYSLIGMSNPRGENRMDYREFAKNSKVAIHNLYGLDAIRAKIEMHSLDRLNMSQMTESQVYNAFELFGVPPALIIAYSPSRSMTPIAMATSSSRSTRSVSRTPASRCPLPSLSLSPSSQTPMATTKSIMRSSTSTSRPS
jgi:Ca2+-binding EF-hand superfamily protein